MNFKEELTKYIDIINNELTKYLKKEDCPEHILNESKGYSLLAGGKFKYANRHIPPRSRRVVYDVEMRKFDERIRNPKTFEKMNRGINKFEYIDNNIKKEDR